MQPSHRRRHVSALHAATFMSSRTSRPEEVLWTPRFHLDLWISLTVHSWVLDVGRPLVMLVLPADWFPLNGPGAAELLQIVFNFSTPLLLVEVLDRGPRTLPRVVVHLGIIAVVMGTSLHLVADSVARRLLLIGYQLHLSVPENPASLQPRALIDVFDLLCHYDDSLGRLMRCVPLFLVLFLFFSGCFRLRTQEDRMPVGSWMLLVPSTAYHWYLITEGQTFILFIFTFFAMTAMVMHQRRRGLVPDSNGLFMLCSFSAALVLVGVWVGFLWSDGVLRKKHPGLIYVPQPRAFYTLHLRRCVTC